MSQANGYRNEIVTVNVGSNRQRYDGTQGQRIMEMAQDGMFPEEWCADLGRFEYTGGAAERPSLRALQL